MNEAGKMRKVLALPSSPSPPGVCFNKAGEEAATRVSWTAGRTSTAERKKITGLYFIVSDECHCFPNHGENSLRPSLKPSLRVPIAVF